MGPAPARGFYDGAHHSLGCRCWRSSLRPPPTPHECNGCRGAGEHGTPLPAVSELVGVESFPGPGQDLARLQEDVDHRGGLPTVRGHRLWLWHLLPPLHASPLLLPRRVSEQGQSPERHDRKPEGGCVVEEEHI